MTAALHFRKAREILDKSRRERARYIEALDRDDRIAPADHYFNLSVTILAVRDWIKKTAPEHGAAAATLVDGEPAMARLFDAANLGKHGGKRDPAHKPRSPIEIVAQSFTAVPEPSPTWYGNPLAPEAMAQVQYLVVPGVAALADEETVVLQTKSKATLKDGTRYFHLDDADAAIDAWAKFLSDDRLWASQPPAGRGRKGAIGAPDGS